MNNNYSKEYWEALEILKQRVVDKEKRMSSLSDVDYDINMLERQIEVSVNKGESSIKLNAIEYSKLIENIIYGISHGELEGTIVTLRNTIKYKLEINI